MAKNRIRFARSVTRNNLPAVLDYGEPGYVKNDRLIIGNDDGTEFIVNDWNVLKNKPDLAGLETSIAFTTDESIQAFRVVRVKPSNGRIVRASKNALATARVIGIVLDEAIPEATALVQSTGVVMNSSWSWTPGDAIYLSNTVGDLTNDISGFTETDARCLIGIAISPTEILLSIQPPQLPGESSGGGGEPGTSVNLTQTVTENDTENAPSGGAVYSHVAGAIAAINLPPDLTSAVNALDGRVQNVEGFETRIETVEGFESRIEDVEAFEDRIDDLEEDVSSISTDVSTHESDILALNQIVTDLNDPFIESPENSSTSFALAYVDNAQSVRFEVSIVNSAGTAGRYETIFAHLVGSTLATSITEHVSEGDTSGIVSLVSVSSDIFELHFSISVGTWNVTARAYPMPKWGSGLPVVSPPLSS